MTLTFFIPPDRNKMKLKNLKPEMTRDAVSSINDLQNSSHLKHASYSINMAAAAARGQPHYDRQIPVSYLKHESGMFKPY